MNHTKLNYLTDQELKEYRDTLNVSYFETQGHLTDLAIERQRVDTYISALANLERVKREDDAYSPNK
jgi:hypothetical protein